MTDIREIAHVACNCVPDLGPEHCHLCGEQQGHIVPWTECVSPGHVDGTSENDRAPELLGKRAIDPADIVLFEPVQRAQADV